MQNWIFSIITPVFSVTWSFRNHSKSFKYDDLLHTKPFCDEWGGAESRGNGARPVELMIMSDTCTTHRSRVPRRSSGRIKGGATTVEVERRPGLDFSLCFVCGSRPWGAAALLLCLFTGAGHIIRISSKSWFISLIPFKKWKLYNVYIHSTQTDVFQVFISLILMIISDN